MAARNQDITFRTRLLGWREFAQGADSDAKAVRGLGNAAKDAGRKAQGAQRGFGVYARETERAGRSAKRAQGNVHGLGRTLGGVGIGYGVAQGLRGIVGASVAFDRALRNVNSIAHLSERQLAGVGKSLREIGKGVGQSPQTLAAGMYDLVSSGFDANQSLLILKSTARAASAGLTDTATSTQAVAAVLNAYHRPATAAANVSDTLFQTVNRGVINFEDLAQNIGDVLPFAASLGVGLEQVGASISTMTKAGISAPETMTRIKSIMETFLKPSEGMTKALDAVGASSGEALVKQKGFQGALEAVISTTDGSKSSIAKMFPNIRALGGALALTGKSSRAANDDLAAFNKTSVTGATNKALEEQMRSTSKQWDLFRTRIESTAIVVGDKFLPAANKVLGWFNQSKWAAKGLGGALAVLAAGFAVNKVLKWSQAIRNSTLSQTILQRSMRRTAVVAGETTAALAAENAANSMPGTFGARAGKFSRVGRLLGRTVGLAAGAALAFEIGKQAQKAIAGVFDLGTGLNAADEDKTVRKVRASFPALRKWQKRRGFKNGQIDALLGPDWSPREMAWLMQQGYPGLADDARRTGGGYLKKHPGRIHLGRSSRGMIGPNRARVGPLPALSAHAPGGSWFDHVQDATQPIHLAAKVVMPNGKVLAETVMEYQLTKKARR